ncbi:MAG: hypothetical protein JXB48_16435 [Candidatus Latescibacteria bacterium]|nr:hypothetical protein [Candidatus Latescibacterota bacterium]
MKPIKVFLLTIVLLFTGFLVHEAFASSKDKQKDKGFFGNAVTEEINITLAGKSGMEIRLEHSFGDIDIRPGENNTIYIKGEKRVTVKDSGITEEFLKQMELEIIERPGKVTIKTNYPDDKYKEKAKNFSISYTIKIPSDVQLSVNNSFGKIDIRDVSGEFTISNGFGSMTAYNLKGNLQLNNKFGSTTAEIIMGNAEISNEHGSLDINQVDGDLRAQSKFGSIKVHTISGDTIVSGGHGAIDCSKISGSAEITNSFGSVDCIDIGGKTFVRNSHAPVTVKDIRDETSVITSFGKASIYNIKGNLMVENQHAAVEVEVIHGNAEINTSFGSANIDQVDGDVVVINQHGSITVTNILQTPTDKRRRVRLNTSFSPIKLSVPGTLSAEVSAQTSQGNFKCDFPLYVNMQNVDLSSISDQKIFGKIGDGKDLIELEGSHANIYLEKY